jgi:hypothetical protein
VTLRKKLQSFIKTHKFVAETNSANKKSGKDLRLEINEYADYSYEEFIKLRGGFKGKTNKEYK